MNDNPAIPGLPLLDNSPHGAYVVDLSQTTRYWNQSAESITGHKAENIVGRFCHEVLQNCTTEGESPMCRDGCPALQAIRENQIPPVYEVSMLCASGHRKTASLTPMLVPEPLVPETVPVYLFHESADEKWSEQATKTGDQMFTTPVPLPETNEKLTPRELAVLKLTALGMTPREISGELHISYHTVRNYTATIRRKIGARNKPNMVRIAYSLNLI